MKPETRFCARVREALEAEGAYVVKHHGSRFGRAGVPDLLVVSRPWTGLLELKVGRNELTPAQRREFRKILRVGGRVAAVRLVDRDHHQLGVIGGDGGWSTPMPGLPDLDDLAAFSEAVARSSSP